MELLMRKTAMPIMAPLLPACAALLLSGCTALLFGCAALLSGCAALAEKTGPLLEGAGAEKTAGRFRCLPPEGARRREDEFVLRRLRSRDNAETFSL
ncbi:MAG: hypothetical protein LBK77_05380, partial [Spirochaetaceae bacterium]|nr:hypothetical protein [Spirochaetaceae bacterium]